MDIQENVPLSDYTTLRVGGVARFFAVVRSVADLEKARQFATQTAVPFLVLGGGSNILVRDCGYDGLVIKNEITGRSYQESKENKVISEYGAGEVLDEVIADTVARGYWGLENLSHIPGTVGATPVQNVGAYGVEVSELIVSVTACNGQTGDLRVFTAAECQFAYRDSFFKTAAGRDWIITAVSFLLHNQPTAVLSYTDPILGYKDMAHLAEQDAVSQQMVRDTIISIRSSKFPDWTQTQTAGSFFMNPVITKSRAAQLAERFPELPLYDVENNMTKVSIAYLLDKVCGLRGVTKNGVGLYEGHALVLVATTDSAATIQAFVRQVVQDVYDATGITIEQEVRTV